MTTLTTTVDDSSPIFQWSPSSSWAPSSSELDRSLSLYYRSTAMYTNLTGAKMLFTFFGNSIKIYGSKRENHGMFQVQLDDQTFDPQSGFAAPPGSFQQELFSRDGLKDELHVVTIKNLEAGKYLDVDFVTWQSALSNEQEKPLVMTVQDSSPMIHYEGTWGTNPGNIGTFSGGTGHVSTEPRSSMQYSFTGSAVAIYGPIDSHSAPYTVQVDDEVPQNFSFIYSQYIPQSLLYFRAGLIEGKCKIKVTHAGTGSDEQVLAIDYLNIFTTPSIDAMSDDRLPPTTIGAIAVGTVTALVLFLISMFYCIRRGHKREKPQSRLSKYFAWWSRGDDDTLEGAKRVTRRKIKGNVEHFDLDGGQYTAVGTTDRETEYLVPNYGPPRLADPARPSGGRAEGETAGARRLSVNLTLLGSDTSRAPSHSTITHSKQQSSLSGLSLLNQPLMRPASPSGFGMGDISSREGTRGQSQSPPPLDPGATSVTRRASSATPIPLIAMNRPSSPPARAPSTSPPPNKLQKSPGRHPTILQPFSLDTRSPARHPQSASEPQSSSRTQPESSQSALQRKQTVAPPLPPGAGRPVLPTHLSTGELGELTSTGSASTLGEGGGSTSSFASGPSAGGVSGGGKGSAVVGPRARSLTGTNVSITPGNKLGAAPPR